MIGILGSGVMGKGIAIELAKHGNKVVLVSAQEQITSEMIDSEIDKILVKYSDTDCVAIKKNIITGSAIRTIAGCDFIIEAVIENIDIKRKTIEEASKYTSDDCIYTSNTSSLSIEKIFTGLVDLSKVCGLHFFNPVGIMKLIELSHLDETSKDTLDKARTLSENIGKVVVDVKDSPGFIVNRLLIPMINEAVKIVDEGVATVEDIDKAMKFGANHPMGPLKLSDLIGNDVTLAILNTLKGDIVTQVSPTLEKMVEDKKLGRKTQKGFYDYNRK